MWTDKHGEDGLRRKFRVMKYVKGTGFSEVEPLPINEFVFVLRPETDRLAWKSLSYYAALCEENQPKLAQDLHDKLKEILAKQLREDPNDLPPAA